MLRARALAPQLRRLSTVPVRAPRLGRATQPALRCRALSTTKPVGPVGAVGGGAPELEEGDAYWWVPYAVMSAIGGLCFWFYRASAAHSNRLEQLDAIGDEVAFDGGEREELRDRNAPFLTAAQFAEVCAETRRVLRASAATDGVGYVAFAEAANRFLDRPLEGGHLLDRVAMVANAQDRRDSEDVELGYLFAALSLCCGGSAVSGAPPRRPPAARWRDLERLVFWLARSGQIDAKKQVAEGDGSFPVQTYVRKDAATIVADALKESSLDEDSHALTEEDFVVLMTAKAIDFK
ncbi:hypothetical protein JL721_6712 [Aureococcus anophagefferens]|nr:hypothetical protein JL721_6712 [Aureococcus anophagefferens]